MSASGPVIPRDVDGLGAREQQSTIKDLRRLSVAQRPAVDRRERALSSAHILLEQVDEKVEPRKMHQREPLGPGYFHALQRGLLPLPQDAGALGGQFLVQLVASGIGTALKDILRTAMIQGAGARPRTVTVPVLVVCLAVNQALQAYVRVERQKRNIDLAAQGWHAFLDADWQEVGRNNPDEKRRMVQTYVHGRQYINAITLLGSLALIGANFARDLSKTPLAGTRITADLLKEFIGVPWRDGVQSVFTAIKVNGTTFGLNQQSLKTCAFLYWGLQLSGGMIQIELLKSFVPRDDEAERCLAGLSQSMTKAQAWQVKLLGAAIKGLVAWIQESVDGHHISNHEVKQVQAFQWFAPRIQTNPDFRRLLDHSLTRLANLILVIGGTHMASVTMDAISDNVSLKAAMVLFVVAGIWGWGYRLKGADYQAEAAVRNQVREQKKKERESESAQEPDLEAGDPARDPR